MPTWPKDDSAPSQEAEPRYQALESPAIEQGDDLAHRRSEAIERSRTAMWELVQQQQRQREFAAEASQQNAEIERAKIAIRDALVDAAIAWLEEKWGVGRQCPYCGTSEWDVRSPLDDFLSEQGPISAHFEVSCKNCGNTALIDAFKAGLLPEAHELENSPLENSPLEEES